MKDVSIDILKAKNLQMNTHYYYRYKFLPNETLSASDHERRLQKAKQNTTSTLLFDFTELAIWPQLPGFILNHTFMNHYLIRPDQIEQAKQLLGCSISSLIIGLRNEKDAQIFAEHSSILQSGSTLLLAPTTTRDLNVLIHFAQSLPSEMNESSIFWDFKPYQPTIKNSLTIKDIVSTKFAFRRLPGLELWNSSIPENYELEPIAQPSWQFRTPNRQVLLSIIIPSFNNITFLTNVIAHLIKQDLPAENYEIIVVEDGGTDSTCSILFDLFKIFEHKINLKMIYWSKIHPVKGKQDFFRAGLARNLANQYAEGDFLFFLDSDMLTPPDFARLCIKHLEKFDVIQFERHHIKQDLSSLNPQFQSIKMNSDTYIEEVNYWSRLFSSPDWMSLENH